MAIDKKHNARKISAILNHLYPNPQIPLKHTSSYTLLIAVLLSAQCTDERVNRVTPKLFELADNPKDMIALTPNKIESVIRSCGLAGRKAKAIHQLSEILMEKYAGEVPCSFTALESLPGVGHKTASVVMAQAFGQPAFPVDTHIHRCAHRWGLSCGKSVVQTEKDLKELFPRSHWRLVHLQIIYFAREYCPALRHHPTQCPICSWIQRL